MINEEMFVLKRSLTEQNWKEQTIRKCIHS